MAGLPGRSGAATKVTATGEAPIDATYELKDPRTVQASHDMNGNRVPPENFPRGAQNRDDFNTNLVARFAKAPDPDVYTDPGFRGSHGPPVITYWPPAGRDILVAGNHRGSIALEAQSVNPDGWSKVTQAYQDNAGKFGIDPAQVKPDDVLYRRIPTPKSLADLERVTRAYNETGIQDFSERGDAANRAANLKPGTVDMVSRAVDSAVEKKGDAATVRQVLDGSDGPTIARQLVTDGVIKYSDENKMFDGKNLTPFGKTTVLNTLAQKMLGDVDTTDHVRDNVVGSAAELLRSDTAAPDVKILEKVRQAAQLVKDAGSKPIDDYLTQGGLSENMDPNAPAETVLPDRVDPEIVNLAKAMRNLKAGKFRNYLKGELARLTKQPDLFGGTHGPRALQPHPNVATMRDSAPLEDSRGPGPGQGRLPPMTPPIQATPAAPPSDWAKSFQFTSQEEFDKSATLKPGEGLISQVIPSTAGFNERSGLARKGAEQGTTAEGRTQAAIERLGGAKKLDELSAIIAKTPGSKLVGSRLVSGTPLNDFQKAAYDQDPAGFDAYAKGQREGQQEITAHDRPLRLAAEALRKAGDDAGAEKLEDQRISRGDLGPNYFPWRFTNGRLVDYIRRFGNNVDAAIKNLKYGGLDFSREGQIEPEEDSVQTARDYWKNVYEKVTQKPLVREMRDLEASLAKDGRGADAGAVKKYLDNNILNESSQIDEDMLRQHVQRMLKDPAYEAKYRNEPINPRPASTAVGWWNGNIADWAVLGNFSSAATKGISDWGRVSSEFGIGDFFDGATQATKYAAAKVMEKAGIELSPEMKELDQKVERIAGISRRGSSDVTGVEGTAGRIWDTVRNAGYAGVRIPDILSKVVATVAAEAEVRRENPTFSDQQVETATAVRVAQITDVAKTWASSPMASHPFTKLVGLFAQSGLRDTTQLYRQLTGGPSGWAKLAVNLGGRAALWGALFKLTKGAVDKEDVLKRVARAIPFIGQAIEGRAPAALFPIQKAGEAVQAAKVAATGKAFGSNDIMAADQRSKTYQKLLPAAVQQSGLRSFFKRKAQ